MALQFSHVRVSTPDGNEAEFLVSGIPREFDDFEYYTTFEDFLDGIEEDTEISVHADAYLYGEGETFKASIEEVAYFHLRMQKDENFLLHTETKVLDKYGRLESINSLLSISYDINPYWYYLDSNNQSHTTMENYNRSTHGELSQITKGVNGNGAMISQTTDSLASEVTRYGYDGGKLTAAVTRDMTNSLRRQETFVYDIADRVTKDRFDHNLTTNEYVTSDIVYVKAASDPTVDNRVSNYSFKINGTQRAKTVNTYDTYKRVTKKAYTIGSKTFTKEIVYDKTKINKVIDSAGGTAQYEYDSMGRISKEKDSSGNILKSYTYDSYGQLIRENNKALDKTFVYEYNNIGNITKVKEYAYTTSSTPSGTPTEKTFTYDSTYPDRLTKCGSTSISYNAIGCPTAVNGYTATWTRGKLSKLSKGSKITGTHSYNYSYNAFGQRIGINYNYMAGTSSSSAIVMGMLTGYSRTFRYDQSGRLVYESKTSQYYGEGSGEEKFVYLYDENSIIGLVHTSESGTTNTYYFQRNLLGDVIGIYNTSGTKVGGYAYDAWGNCTITLNTNGIAAKNPIRYRGYYYDNEFGLYYLNARYYSPEWRRFISPYDTAYLDTEKPNGINLYVYCNNDPVNYKDPSGRLAITTIAIITGAIIGFGISATSSIVTQLEEHNGDWSKVNPWEVLYDGAFGAINGGLAASGISIVASAIFGGVFGFVSSVGRDFLFEEDRKINWLGAVNSLFIGALAGLIAGAGANYAKDGMQIVKFGNSRDILNRTIANGTQRAIARQTHALNVHATQLLISGIRYMLSNTFSTSYTMLTN